MAIVDSEAEGKEIDMPDAIIRDNVGFWLSVFGFLYGLLAAAVGFINKRLSKLRDHDEDIRRLTTTQQDTAEFIACMRLDHSNEVHDRREEEAKIYARIEANSARYDTKVDEIKNSLHELGIRVERAIRGE
jgi:membrane-anchored protein YejM (alkaline phosphatase superfamily)